MNSLGNINGALNNLTAGLGGQNQINIGASINSLSQQLSKNINANSGKNYLLNPIQDESKNYLSNNLNQNNNKQVVSPINSKPGAQLIQNNTNLNNVPDFASLPPHLQSLISSQNAALMQNLQQSNQQQNLHTQSNSRVNATSTNQKPQNTNNAHKNDDHTDNKANINEYRLEQNEIPDSANQGKNWFKL